MINSLVNIFVLDSLSIVLITVYLYRQVIFLSKGLNIEGCAWY